MTASRRGQPTNDRLDPWPRHPTRQRNKALDRRKARRRQTDRQTGGQVVQRHNGTASSRDRSCCQLQWQTRRVPCSELQWSRQVWSINESCLRCSFTLLVRSHCHIFKFGTILHCSCLYAKSSVFSDFSCMLVSFYLLPVTADMQATEASTVLGASCVGLSVCL